MRHNSAQVFGADLDPFSLQDLANVEKGFEILWLRILTQHVFADQLVAARVALMGHHHRRFDIAIGGRSVGADRFKLRKRLKTVFAHEARKLFFIIGKRSRSVPDLPVVEVTHLLRLRIILKI